MNDTADSLRKLTPGDRAEVTGFNSGAKSYRERLMSMGLTKGAQFTFRKAAPLGDPVEIEVRGFKLSLRKGEADALKIRRVTE
jgi:ferrous iron transport protein A